MNSPANPYVSRAGLKLDSVAGRLGLNFKNKTVLDVGSSTGGFTDYALRHGATRVIAVDAGTQQLHSSLRSNPKIELHEKTDIRDFVIGQKVDIVLADVSFISLRAVLPKIIGLCPEGAQIVALVKPQFEARAEELNRGVVKNDSIRRRIFKDFESWSKNYFTIKSKADSEVAGASGNQERFYLLMPAKSKPTIDF
jgi:23S rRNA (cytidine1920-2'-O)/16S rRNA (cytidine1409-2'-O)-methyltransferase